MNVYNIIYIYIFDIAVSLIKLHLFKGSYFRVNNMGQSFKKAQNNTASILKQIGFCLFLIVLNI